MTVDGGAPVSIAATATDPDGTVNSVLWVGSGSFNPPNALNTVWTAPAGLATDAAYNLALTATDDSGATGQSFIQMTVRAAEALTAAAGDAAFAFTIPEAAITLTLPLQISIAEANVSADAAHVISLTVNADQGAPDTYAWAQMSGPTADTANANQSTVWILAPHDFTASTLVFRCTVTDINGATQTVDGTIAVAARPPVQTQTGKGATDPLPPRQDAYRFLSGSQLWDSRPGRTITWSNATNRYNLFQDGRQAALDGGALSARHLLWMRSALMIWTDIVDVVWSEVADDPQNNLRVGYGDSGLLSIGATSYTNDGRAVLTLNTRLIDGGTILGISFGSSVVRTPRHEVGHVLGLEHPDGNHSSPLMETQSHEGSGHVMEPQLGDIIGAWHLFGPATNAENMAPDAPTSMQFDATPAGVEVSWGEPRITGGMPVTGYIVNGPSEQATIERRHTYPGLTPGQSYNFYVRASNGAGTGLENRRTNFRVPDVLWAFALPEPTITHTRIATLDHAVNAGDVAWAFALPQPTTHKARTYRVNAGDAAWEFILPQPTAKKSLTYRVNPADVRWAFVLPEPAITYRPMMAYRVNAGPVDWEFSVPRAFAGIERFLPVNAGAVRWHFRVLDADHYTIPALPMMAAPIPVTDRIIALDDLLDLLISQYTGNAPINALLRGMYELIDTEMVQALKDLERMRNWDTAEGVWLNYIGRRLGMERPSIDTVVTRLGFDGGDGVGFNQAPFATATGFVPQVAVSDAVYLLCLKVWAGTILTSGTIPDMNAAVQRSFPNAYYTDGADSTIALATGASGAQQTTARNILTAADAWPRPAGVGLTVT